MGGDEIGIVYSTPVARVVDDPFATSDGDEGSTSIPLRKAVQEAHPPAINVVRHMVNFQEL